MVLLFYLIQLMGLESCILRVEQRLASLKNIHLLRRGCAEPRTQAQLKNRATEVDEKNKH